jgi:hypothetical protein
MSLTYVDGLSYTTFEYANASLATSSHNTFMESAIGTPYMSLEHLLTVGGANVTLNVTNTGL